MAQHSRVWAIVAGTTALLAATALLVMAITVRAQFAPGPWNPLGPFPTQEVTVITSDFVHVVGTKCYDEPVRVRGTFGWQRVDPPGFAITLGEGTADRDAGCLTQEFDNDIPDAVIEANLPGSIWRIVGTETPISETTEGVSLTWQTETFSLP